MSRTINLSIRGTRPYANRWLWPRPGGGRGGADGCTVVAGPQRVQDYVNEQPRRRLVAGLVAVAPLAGGLGVLGVSGYVFLAVAGRALGPVAFAPLSVLWAVVFTIASGVLVPFEQETGREIADRRARGLGPRPVALLSLGVATALVSAFGVALLLLRQPLADLLFRGDERLVYVTGAATVAMAAAYVTKGVFAGLGQFTRYGAQLALEGLVRSLGAVVLFVSAVRTVTAYAWLLALAPLLALGLTAPRRAHLGDGPAAARATYTRRIATLIATGLLCNGMINSGPVLVELLSPGDGEAPGIFLAALVMARGPLFVFAAVQAVVLPRLAGARRVGRDAFLRTLWTTGRLVGMLAAGGVVVLGVFGPEIVSLLFGRAYQADRLVVILLAAGSGVYMLAILINQAVIALERHGTALLAWLVAVTVMAVVTAALPDLQLRVAVGMLAGSTTAGVLLLVAVLHGVTNDQHVARHAGLPPSPGTEEA